MKFHLHVYRDAVWHSAGRDGLGAARVRVRGCVVCFVCVCVCVCARVRACARTCVCVWSVSECVGCCLVSPGRQTHRLPDRQVLFVFISLIYLWLLQKFCGHRKVYTAEWQKYEQLLNVERYERTRVHRNKGKLKYLPQQTEEKTQNV